MNVWGWNIVGNKLRGKNKNSRGRTSPIASWSVTNPTWTGPASKCKDGDQTRGTYHGPLHCVMHQQQPHIKFLPAYDSWSLPRHSTLYQLLLWKEWAELFKTSLDSQRPESTSLQLCATHSCLLAGKTVPLQTWSGPEGSRRFRLPDFMTTAQDGGKVVSLTQRPPLPQWNTPGTHFCLRLSRPQGHSATGRIMSLKNSNGTIGNRTRDLPVCSVVS
jgi:hypothetical protein